jgi:hypothetical protein
MRGQLRLPSRKCTSAIQVTRDHLLSALGSAFTGASAHSAAYRLERLEKLSIVVTSRESPRPLLNPRWSKTTLEDSLVDSRVISLCARAIVDDESGTRPPARYPVMNVTASRSCSNDRGLIIRFVYVVYDVACTMSLVKEGDTKRRGGKCRACIQDLGDPL